MKKSLWFYLAAVTAALTLGMTGCDKHQERYEDPPWLGGSSIETLEERGNYNVFLRLMERANYKDAITKQLFTLFVPDDDAFETYFQSIGKNSVEDLTDDEAVQLFTLHVLRNPRSRFYLIYEYAWSELQTPKAEYASLFHRKITPSTSIPYKETVRYVPGQVGKELLIYTGVKNIALWTTEFFGDFGGALDGSDYLFMYPGSQWEPGYTENLNGMNWHNAAVIPNPEIPDELEVRTASGFIYFLDRVVPPMPSIEEYMIAHQDKYGLYYDLLQRFAAYGNSKVDEERNVLYMKQYELVFNLAEERGPSTNTAVPPQNMWTAFLPKDDILQDYLDNTIMKYYETIDSVPRVTLFYILQSQLSSALVLKSKLRNGYFNAFGDHTELYPEDLKYGYMCSNGVVYELDHVLEPNVFTTVAGTLFFDKNYSTLLSVLNQANILSSISNPDANVTVFATTNDKLEEYGIRYNATTDVVEFRGPVDGKWGPMREVDLTMFAQDQIYMGLLSDIDGPGGFAEMTSGNYIQYGNNQAGAGENQIYDLPAVVQDIEVNPLNGYLLKVDRPIGSRIVMGQILTGDLADPDLSEFSQVLIDLRLLDDKYRDPITKEVIPKLKFLAAADYWTGLIPTNAAMEQARLEGIIPPAPDNGRYGPDAADSLENFVMYHFIKNDVIFDDGKESGMYQTNYTYKDTVLNETVNSPLKVINVPNDLAVVDSTGQEVHINHADADRIVQKGVLHKIGSVLKYTEL
jgi:uncharacterized surface protein with fasciclin (FAS1) repeats